MCDADINFSCHGVKFIDSCPICYCSYKDKPSVTEPNHKLTKQCSLTILSVWPQDISSDVRRILLCLAVCAWSLWSRLELMAMASEIVEVGDSIQWACLPMYSYSHKFCLKWWGAFITYVPSKLLE